jgi:hypothetical protein
LLIDKITHGVWRHARRLLGAKAVNFAVQHFAKSDGAAAKSQKKAPPPCAAKEAVSLSIYLY